jgi:uncharacterized lipoprotein YmbA
MKRLGLATAVLLCGCSSEANSYVVETEQAVSPVTSAMVSVCRQRAWALERSGTRFAGTRSANCEGSGFVRLTHQDGTTTDCPVGYVTVGAGQSFTYVVTGRACD